MIKLDIGLMFNELIHVSSKVDIITNLLISINNFSFIFWVLSFKHLSPNYIYTIKDKKVEQHRNLQKDKPKNQVKMFNIFSLIFNFKTFFGFHIISIIVFLLNFNKIPYTISICLSFEFIFFFISIYQLILYAVSDEMEDEDE